MYLVRDMKGNTVTETEEFDLAVLITEALEIAKQVHYDLIFLYQGNREEKSKGRMAPSRFEQGPGLGSRISGFNFIRNGGLVS